MKNVILVIVAVLMSILTYAQKPRQSNTKKATVKQGICGTILLKRGNHMPGPDKTVPAGQPVEREVLIYPVLTIDAVDMGSSGFIKDTQGIKPVKVVKSDKQGKFCVSLPVGQYSVVVREPKGLYANLFDSQNRIFPVTVQTNQQATATVEITHQAVF